MHMALDRALGELLVAAGGDAGAHQVELTIVSDHGSGGSSDSVLYLNRALAEAGLLTFHESPVVMDVAKRVKELALTKLPPVLRERLFGLLGTALPSALESRARFGAIDFTRTQCFSDELNYMPAVHLNLAGREPEGVVQPRDIPQVRARLTAALLSLRDPLTGRTRGGRRTPPRGLVRRPLRRARARPAARSAPRPWLQLQPHALGQRAAGHGLLPAPGPR